jgi:hypothetical protein
MKPLTTTDEKLQTLVSEHAAQRLHAPFPASSAGEVIVEPVGMTLEDEAEVEILIELADAPLDGDERAAITRLVTALDEAPLA